MAEPTPNADPPPASLIGRLLHSVLRPKRTTLIIVAGFACLVTASALAMTLLGPQPEPVDTYPKAWDLINETRFAEARAMATRLLIDRDSEEVIGEGSFLIGRALCGEAETEWNERRRTGLYLIASRYLQEAYHEGLPEGHEDDGVYYLALATFESGRPTASLPYWKELAQREPIPYRIEVLRRLADIHLKDRHLDPEDGLSYLNQLSSDEHLGRAERDQALIDSADLWLRADEFQKGIEALEQVASDSVYRPRQRLLRARILLASAEKAENLTRTGAPSETPIEPLYEQAVSELLGVEAALSDDTNDGDLARFHLAQCYSKLGDLDRAEQLFAEIRRAHPDDSLGWTAGVEEAHALYLQADLKDATLRFQAILAAMKHQTEFDDRWMSQEGMETRLNGLIEQLLQQGQFADALMLAQAMWPPLPRSSSLEWQARIRRQWGEALLVKARDLEPDPTEPIDPLAVRTKGLEHLREAGWAHFKLANLERATEDYLDHLLDAAAAFSDGHDFAEAVQVYEQVLDEDRRGKSAWLLLQIGECHLGAGNVDQALLAFDRCIASYPADPDSYLARLSASRIHLERDDAATAERLLLENLENAALTPQSREWRLSLFALARTLYREASLLEAESRALGVDEGNADNEPAFKKLEESYAAFQEAIRRLNEAVRRYETDPQIHEYRYLLAEAHRAAAKWPRKKSVTVTVAASRSRLEEQARDHTRQATAVIADLLQNLARTQDTRPLDEVESNLLRNCYFARADLLFDLEQYPEAIDAYSSAANRYNDRPESLEAFVRLSTCFRRTGRFEDARGVLEQAKLFLEERIPADADFSGTTRHTRDEWRSFLELLSNL